MSGVSNSIEKAYRDGYDAGFAESKAAYNRLKWVMTEKCKNYDMAAYRANAECKELRDVVAHLYEAAMRLLCDLWLAEEYHSYIPGDQGMEHWDAANKYFEIIGGKYGNTTWFWET